MLAAVALIAGCGGSDNGTNPPPSLPVITANTTAGSPSVTDANDAVWNGVTATSMNVSSSISPKIAAGKTASVSATVAIQAIVSGDSLFIRLRFADATYSIWRDYYEVSSAGPPVNFTSYQDLEGEDQVFVMFDGGSDFGWDVWNWRVLTTDARGVGGLAEGMKFVGGALVSDAGNATLATHNPGIAQTPQPTYVHADTTDYHGAILPLDSIRSGYPTSGWTVGQRVPGWIINSAVKDTGSVAATQRASRFDIRSASVYDSTTSMYSVVMAAPLNTGFTDDLDLSTKTSVTAKVGIFDDQIAFLTGGSSRGFTGNFTLKLK
jgi:hypothetical protein